VSWIILHLHLKCHYLCHFARTNVIIITVARTKVLSPSRGKYEDQNSPIELAGINFLVELASSESWITKRFPPTATPTAPPIAPPIACFEESSCSLAPSIHRTLAFCFNIRTECLNQGILNGEVSLYC
jgi:hypothetical protein